MRSRERAWGRFQVICLLCFGTFVCLGFDDFTLVPRAAHTFFHFILCPFYAQRLICADDTDCFSRVWLARGVGRTSEKERRVHGPLFLFSQPEPLLRCCQAGCVPGPPLRAGWQCLPVAALPGASASFVGSLTPALPPGPSSHAPHLSLTNGLFPTESLTHTHTHLCYTLGS